MRRTSLTLVIACVVAAVGLGLAHYKWQHFAFPLSPSERFKSWYVELSVSVSRPKDGSVEAAELTLRKPRDREALAVANPQLLARGFGIEETAWRYSITKRRPDGRESLLLRFSLYELDVNDTSEVDSSPAYAGIYHPKNRLSNADEATRLFYDEIDRLLAEAKSRSSSPVSLTREIAKILKDEPATYSLLKENMQAPDAPSVIVELLRADKIRARVANGFTLSGSSSGAPLIRWIEVRHKGIWRRYKYSAGELKPADHVYSWWYGDKPLIEAPASYQLRTSLSYKANNDGAFTRSLWLSQQEKSFAYDIALQTLPLQQQMVLQILLLLPLGALIVAFFRQMVGLQTFGTFMPVLIALALRETGLWYGIAFFTGIVLIGLMARFYVGKLQLLMVPRLTAILSIVVLVIVCFMLANKSQTLPLGISVALFPVVIIVMFIERLSTLLDEVGSRAAFVGCAGSLFVASIIYLITTQPLVQHLVFTFPEHLLVVLAIAMLMGRYNGYKLSEYWRFWQLRNQIQKDV